MFQKVYQLCSQIPKGKVSTYKIISQFAYNSPNYARRVGNLLSHCPDCKLNSQNHDCPRVHCYRVIKSDFQIGGFLGETKKELVKIKREKLAGEGIFFDQKGYLLKDLREKVIFKDFL
jgi:methylated-DNA-[protein]-cysteine S-methyltransferase